MIIKTVKGNAVDMFLDGQGHLIHGCNCFNNMGAGIAREIKQKIPGAYQVDVRTRKGDSRKMGTNSIYEHIVTGGFVFNAYTQFDFWTPGVRVDYRAVESCFTSAAKHAIMHGMDDMPIITPLIGAGLAGGDWERIREIIDQSTGKYPVVVVEFRK